MNLTLRELKSFIEGLDDREYDIGLSSVDAWRGLYGLPAFTFGRNITRAAMLALIEEVLTQEFAGYKGGLYEYTEETDVEFDCYGVFSDGAYLMYIMLKHADSDFFKALLNWYNPNNITYNLDGEDNG